MADSLVLVKRRKTPPCVPRSKSLSLEHALLYCSDLIEVRESLFKTNSLKVLVGDVFLDSIFDFHKEMNVLN